MCGIRLEKNLLKFQFIFQVVWKFLFNFNHCMISMFREKSGKLFFFSLKWRKKKLLPEAVMWVGGLTMWWEVTEFPTKLRLVENKSF